MEKKSRRLTALLSALAVAGLFGLPAGAQAVDPSASADDYASGDFGRVTYEENGIIVVRAHGDPGSGPVTDLGINSPIYPGDVLSTGGDQRAEIQLAGGSLVRVARASEVTFLSLPDPYAKFADHTVLQVAEGTIRVAALVSGDDEFRIDTPAASIYLLGDGDFRIEVHAGGRTELVSRRGVAEIVGEGGSVLVRGGMRTEAFPGALPEDPWAFNTFVADGFDRWVDEREAAYIARTAHATDDAYAEEAYQELPSEVRPYYQELSAYGNWVYTDDYGYVWQPASVPSGWRPYYDGYWDYGPGGWFWVSYEPWGWAPYHWGRWNWYAGIGWCWAPGSVFGGAWVAWSWGSAYVGWAPLNYWGAPCWARPVYYGYYDPYCWTFVPYTHVAHRETPRYAVPVDRVGDDLRHATVVSRAPRVRPGELETSREARVRAMRSAESDTSARMRPIDTVQSRDRGRSFREVERSMTPGDARGQAAGREVGRSPSAASRRTLESYGRRISADTGGSGARRVAPGRGPRSTSGPAAETPKRSSDRSPADSRVRDLYRRVGGSGPDRATAGESTGRAGSRATPPRSQTRTEDRSRSSERRTQAGPSGGRERAPVRRGPSSGPRNESRQGSSSGNDRGRGAGTGAARRPSASPAAPPANRGSSRATPRSGSGTSTPRPGAARGVPRSAPPAGRSPSAGPRGGSAAPSRSGSAGSRSGGGGGRSGNAGGRSAGAGSSSGKSSSGKKR